MLTIMIKNEKISFTIIEISFFRKFLFCDNYLHIKITAEANIIDTIILTAKYMSLK